MNGGFSRSLLELSQPLFQKPPFRFLLGQGEGPFIGSAGL